jgi:hypothetical protein
MEGAYKNSHPQSMYRDTHLIDCHRHKDNVSPRIILPGSLPHLTYHSAIYRDRLGCSRASIVSYRVAGVRVQALLSRFMEMGGNLS